MQPKVQNGNGILDVEDNGLRMVDRRGVKSSKTFGAESAALRPSDVPASIPNSFSSSLLPHCRNMMQTNFGQVVDCLMLARCLRLKKGRCCNDKTTSLIGIKT
jgi:hypothetical protein